MNLNSLTEQQSVHAYHTPHFREVLEKHLQLLQFTSRTIDLPAQTCIVYARDFYGAAKSLSIPDSIQWITMRANGISSSMHWEGKAGMLIVPDLSQVDKLLTTHLSSTRG